MPCCLVFSIVILRFSAIRNLLSDSVSLFKFPLIRVKATCILDFEVILLETKKKTFRACQPPQFLHRIIVQG